MLQILYFSSVYNAKVFEFSCDFKKLLYQS